MGKEFGWKAEAPPPAVSPAPCVVLSKLLTSSTSMVRSIKVTTLPVKRLPGSASSAFTGELAVNTSTREAQDIVTGRLPRRKSKGLISLEGSNKIKWL